MVVTLYEVSVTVEAVEAYEVSVIVEGVSDTSTVETYVETTVVTDPEISVVYVTVEALSDAAEY